MIDTPARHKVLPSGGLLIVDTRRLTDQGLYSCVAINTLSQQRVHARSSTNLIINQGLPSFLCCISLTVQYFNVKLSIYGYFLGK